MEAAIEEWRCNAESSFGVNVDVLLSRCAPPHLAFLCNPNNPTGTYLPLDGVARLAGA